jgi:hypothetical protein
MRESQGHHHGLESLKVSPVNGLRNLSATPRLYFFSANRAAPDAAAGRKADKRRTARYDGEAHADSYSANDVAALCCEMQIVTPL